jgi:D-threo-aldose 1-dehydrogenase
MASPPLSEQRRTLGGRGGRPGFGVTALGLGCGTISSPAISDADALGAVATAVEIGFGFFDTAPWYGRLRSERRLGVALSNHPREAFHLQTKVGRFAAPGMPNDQDSAGRPIVPYQGRAEEAHGEGFGMVHDYRYESVLRQHQDSLQRLGVPHVDSLVIHDLDLGYGSRDQVEGYLRELEGGARALAELRAAGTIKAFGCGCNAFAPDLQRCDEFARRIADIADLDFFLIAGGHYTLLDQQALDVQFPIIMARDMRAVIGTPQAAGRLAGENGFGATYNGERETLEQIRALCKKFAVPVGAAALQFPLAHPHVATVIPGSANATEVAQNKAYVDMKIPGGLWRSLKEAGVLRADAPTPADPDGKL